MAIPSSAPGETSAEAATRCGLALHRAGSFAEAKVQYELALVESPRHLPALHLLGLIALREDQPRRALGLLDDALGIDPSRAALHFDRANALAELGEREAALAGFERTISLDPAHPAARHHRGVTLMGLGRRHAALEDFDAMSALQPDNPEVWHWRGNALAALRRFTDAASSYERAVSLDTDFAEAHCNLGNVRAAVEDWGGALASYERALVLAPDLVEAIFNRGNLHKARRRFDAALMDYDAVIERQPRHADAHCNRGMVLQFQDRWDDALASYDLAIHCKPDHAQAHSNRAALLLERNDVPGALEACDRAIAAEPGHAGAHFNRATAALLGGRYQQGWRDYEWRWMREDGGFPAQRRDWSQPRWSGAQGLSGRRIVLHAEQGLGDTLQFCRYATAVAERGARVILEVPKPLAALLASVPGVAEVVTSGETLPEFDYYAPMMSLPLAFGTRLDSVPATIPYLRADLDKRRFWRELLGPKSKPRVGLVWSGGFRPDQPEQRAQHTRRNVPLRMLAPLAAADVEFVSLQKGEAAESELRELAAGGWAGPRLRDFTSQLQDFSDTAALVEQLDLVISVDTSTAHLAGALGRPVWLLNRFDTCWRWMLDRTDSPWYPTLTLYRQAAPGEWHDAIEQVARDLRELAGEMVR